MKNWGSKSNLQITILLICLAVGAAVAAYFIYFQNDRYSTPSEIDAKARFTPPETIKTKYTGKLSESERRDLELASAVSEFSTPVDRTVPAMTELPTPPDASAFEKPKTGMFTDALKAKSEAQPQTADKNIDKTPVKPVKKEKPILPPSEPEPPKPSNLASTTVPLPQPEPPEKQTPQPLSEPSPEKVLPDIKPSPPAIPVPLGGDTKKTDEESELTVNMDLKPPSPKTKGNAYWAINALSTENKEKARDAMGNLAGLPYRVYAYKTEVRGKTYWRIRVGFFKNYEDAAKIGKELSAKYKFPKPWIVMPGPEELSKYNQ